MFDDHPESPRQVGLHYGRELLDAADLRVFCKDCHKFIVWVTFVGGRPLVAAMESNDPLQAERRDIGRFLDYSWLDRSGGFVHARCRHRFLMDAYFLRDKLPARPGASRSPDLRVSHGQSGGLIL